MAKIPVTRTVMRDGKPHIQTYWEESDPKKTAAKPLLPQVPVSPSDQRVDPVRKAWNNSPLVNKSALKRNSEEVEAAIAAGFTPEAALYLKAHSVPAGESLTDYIYENELDQLPRPRDGWQNSGGSDDQRRSWMRAVDDGITLEQAVEWIDAGFPQPWSGIPALIKDGVTPERALEWEQDQTRAMYNYGRQIGGSLYLHRDELLSDMTLEETKEWRKAMSDSGASSLDQRDIEFRNLGFTPVEAARWNKVMYRDVPVGSILELKKMGWSPSSIKATASQLFVGAKVSDEFTNELIRITPLVGGPKVVKGWIKTVYQSWDDGFGNPRAVDSVVEAEAWKAKAKNVTGVPIDQKEHRKLASLLPKQRDAYLDVMTTEGREADQREFKVSRAMDLARTIGSSENYRFLQEKGFPLGSTDNGVVQASGHAGTSRGYDVFDAASASKEDQDKWLRSMATSMYWINYSETSVSGDDRRRIIENKDIDPVKLKDALLSHRGAIRYVQLEGIVAGGVESAVSGGWL